MKVRKAVLKIVHSLPARERAAGAATITLLRLNLYTA